MASFVRNSKIPGMDANVVCISVVKRSAASLLSSVPAGARS